MTQIGTVTAVPEPGTAVVQVARQSACAHNCAGCAGCGAMAGSLSVRARRRWSCPRRPGGALQRRRVLGHRGVVYLAGGAVPRGRVPAPAGLPEGLPVRPAGGWGSPWALGAVVCDRRLRRRGGAVRYQVIRKL